MFLFLLGCLLGGYLLGSLNASIIFGNLKGTDIRNAGSKNAGLTNALRVFGKKAAIFVFFFDLLKAVLAVYFSRLAAEWLFAGEDMARQLAQYFSGLGAVLGHNFPLYFKFKGGKGILTSWGVIMMLDYRIAIILILIFLLTLFSTRYFSLSSVICSVSYPVVVLIFSLWAPSPTSLYYILLSVIMGALAVYRHRANIGRLKAGTESKLWAKKDKKE